jgi:poly(hydroxyalkanoate) granule-associated protein
MARTIRKREAQLWDLPQDLIERGKEMADRGRDIWLAGLGAVATVEEEGSTLFSSLVERGRKMETAGRAQIGTVRKQIVGRQREVVDAVEENVYEPLIGAMRRFGVPTRTEVRELSSRVDLLTRKVDVLVNRLGGKAAVTLLTVIADGGGEGWVIREEGREEPISVHATKDEAVERARSLAHDQAPSRLSIYKQDGSIQDTLTYGG